MYNYKFILQTAFHLNELLKVSDSQVTQNFCGKLHFWHLLLPEVLQTCQTRFFLKQTEK